MKWQELEYQQKVAVARIVSDAILADKIIDVDEIRKYQELVGSDYESDLFYKSKKFHLAHAIDVIQRNTTEIKDFVYKILYGIIFSDGICSPSEAKFQTALDYCLRQNNVRIVLNKRYNKYEIKSLKLSDLFIGQRFVFYIEEKYNDAMNTEIIKNYSIISHLLASIGFQFVYIPK